MTFGAYLALLVLMDGWVDGYIQNDQLRKRENGSFGLLLRQP
jgi:hypothetical protein